MVRNRGKVLGHARHEHTSSFSEYRFDSRLQHVSCCVPDECPDSGEFRVDPVSLCFLVGASFSRLVWVRRTFHVVGSFDENTSFRGTVLVLLDPAETLLSLVSPLS